jgi:hypothetical protein
MVCVAALLFAVCGRGGSLPAQPTPRPTTRHALLVGVTRYDHLDPFHHLKGPANDVDRLRTLLLQRFGYPAESIRCLTEAEGKPDRRPTRANIVRELERLARVVHEGDQVVILLAGHGAQQPEPDAPAPDHIPEPDGLDEVFLPADARAAPDAGGRIPGALIDDEIGRWLRAITARRAYVWAVFDCCHSGDMIRDPSDGSERVRELPPDTLVQKERLVEARQRARLRKLPARNTPGFIRPEPDPHLVALYACRPEQQTVEGLLPAGDPKAQWNGLLTYTLCEVLTQAAAPLTYQELAQRIQVQYARQHPGRHTPGVEGLGQAREVLGTREWPRRSDLLLRANDGKYRVNQGDLHGLTPGSVLAVYPPAGDANPDQLLGHVRITASGIFEADAEPCTHDKTPLRTDLPALGICRLVFLDYGPRRFRLRVDLPEGEARKVVLDEVQELAESGGGPAEIVEDPARAEWLLRARRGGLELAETVPEGPRFALPGPGRDLRRKFSQALEKIYRARNLLRVAARADSGLVQAQSQVRVQVDVLRHRHKDDPGEVVPLTDGIRTLREGEQISLRVGNRSLFPIDVSLLVVDAGLGISPFFPKRKELGENVIAAGGTLVTPPPPGVVRAPLGAEYLVIIAGRSRTPPPDFTCLAQETLQQCRGEDRGQSLNSPLGQLLESALFRTHRTRGLEFLAFSEHTVRLLPWRTVPR